MNFFKRMQYRLVRHTMWYSPLVRLYRSIRIPFMGGIPFYLVVHHFWTNIEEDSITLRASSVAFNIFLSLFPSLIFLFTLLAYIPVENLADEALEFLHSLMPENAYVIIRDTLEDILRSRRGNLLSITLLLAFYFASNGMLSMMEVYNRADASGILVKRLRAIVLTLVLGTLLIVAVVVLVIAQFLIMYITDRYGVPDATVKQSILGLQWFVIMIILFLACTIMYRHGDIRSTRWRYTFPGSVLATFLMLLTSIGYAWYVDNFTNYNRLYGSLGALIMTMLWIYFNCIGLIIGHEFNRSLMQARLDMMSKRESPQEKPIQTI